MARKLFIIHGWAYTVQPWDKTLQLLREANVEPVILHVPGLTAPSKKVWDIGGYVDWLDRQLQKEKRPVVLGHSNGGRILLNYSLKHPKTLQHMILLNSAGITDDSIKKRVKKSVVSPVAKIGTPLKRVPILRRVGHKLIGASDYAAAPENMKRTLTNMLDSDKDLRPEHITTPTTILWGLGDKTTPKIMGDKLHKAIANSKLITFSDWGHAPYRTHPAELASAVKKVLESLQ